jgi:hypothetical protein
MGLKEKEIYLQIWNRSSRSSLDDYQYLHATKDSKAIKGEIEKKLKKESMVLREVMRLEESCHEMNRQFLHSSTCNEEHIKDFVTSHFLLKKLKVYKDIAALDRMSLIEQSMIEESSNNFKQLKIDVHNYFHYKNIDIKGLLTELISEMVFSLKNNAKIIRLTIKNFKFIYRLIYKEILEDIIHNVKESLIDLFN